MAIKVPLRLVLGKAEILPAFLPPPGAFLPFLKEKRRSEGEVK